MTAGIPIAFGCIAAWLVTFGLGLWADLPLTVVVLLRTFAFSALFITAHDAMHGTVAPRLQRLNDGIGTLALALYGGLHFGVLRRAHHAHHAGAARDGDPDWSVDQRLAPWLWSFAVRYIDRRVILSQGTLVTVLWLAGIPLGTVLAVQVVPAFLSLLQLFVFGTWLPHRAAGAPFVDDHRARSTRLGSFGSLVTCFHFGLHWEHHVMPQVPWWGLPRIRARAAAAVLPEATAADPR